MFLPTTAAEMRKLGWEKADVIIVSGDAYIDSPFSGAALVGKFLLNAGYRAAVISQPGTDSPDDIMRLGSPALFWGVTAGCTDSIVANYTALGKKRRSCDFTAGGENIRRPDRASIVYSNLIRRFDREKRPIVLGGIEASLRRFAHYDSLSDSIRRPLLFDAKADYLIYGMGEYPALALAEAIRDGNDPRNIRGLCYIAKTPPEDALILPTFEDTQKNKTVFENFFAEFYGHASSLSPQILAQKAGDRYLIQNPSYSITSEELDNIYSLDFERSAHPYDLQKGEVKAVETVKFSITSHRGCFGECNFCAISAHQGRAVVSRSEKSVLDEAHRITKMPAFKGYISDVGGPTANMYGSECSVMRKGRVCEGKRCLHPAVCHSLSSSQKRYTALLASIRKIEGVKKVFTASGIRCDLALADKENGKRFVEELAKYHTSGQIKLAPEHADRNVLSLMGKSDLESVEKFAALFEMFSEQAGKKQFVTYYFLAAHPGSTPESAVKLKAYIRKHFHFKPEQVQIFTPTPSTWSTCMYHTCGYNGKPLYVPKSAKEKSAQKDV